MKTLRFIFCQKGGEVCVGKETYAFPANYFVVTDTNAKVHQKCAHCQVFDFHIGELQSLYRDIANLLEEKTYNVFQRDTVKLVKADNEVAQVVHLLGNAKNPATLLRFVYVYCLGHDRHYFSALLKQSIAGDQPFLEFIEKNFLNPWPISHFAKEFDIPLRKFNMLFQEKFGTSAKHWLLIRRLNHARELLLTTSMRILDVAIECGFSNHAHFTGSFRKHFACSPSEVRHMMTSDTSQKQGTQKNDRAQITRGEHYGFTSHQ